jgi:2,4-dienoyl-CoA reductase-like NADH-dependent reductase (Old Yellow Enzyme family)
MAPLTRCRAVDDRIPNDLMATYYEQRASAGMILSEATAIGPMAVGYANTPGIWKDAHVDGWKRITERVHAAGGRILLQLWHVGRISDPHFLDGALPVAPSAIAQDGCITRLAPDKPYVTPRALETEEIPRIVADYRAAAERALTAGFDGVEIHGANGYLLDQFLHTHANRRTDAYGGSIPNRARLLLEVTDAVCEVWGPDRVGVHLAPRGDEDAAAHGDGFPLFLHVAEELGKRSIAFLCAREPHHDKWFAPALKEAFGGVYIANQEFTRETAEAVLAAGEVDAVAFGRSFIANPDLPERLRRQAPLNDPDPSTFYGSSPAGYTDYPALA